MTKRAFHESTKKACADPSMAEKLHRATDRQFKAREAICGELGDVQAFRDLAAAVRDEALDGLDELLSTFAQRLEVAGVNVHWAEDAAAARSTIREIGQARNVTRVVKSKSMLTEEIALTPELEAAGMEVVETDLGEFIIQLAGQPPSHIVLPAVHLSAQDVYDIFLERIGYEGAPDPEPMTKAARRYLRNKFAEAQMGISGVNFAAADPGCWAICTNEGNGRYAVNLPDLHVAVMGAERIVADLDAAAVILKMLGRFATGQRITQYVSFTRGPSAGRNDGPKEIHLVIVDNGRSRILGSPYRDMLRCIRCGACLNVCPVFRRIGGQAFPGCYSGPMGSVLLPLQKGLKTAGETARACTLCRMCVEVCPVKIPLTALLLDLRGDLADGGFTPWLERAGMGAASWVATHPAFFHLAQKAARFGLGPRSFEGWVKRLPSLGKPWTEVKDFPLPAKESFLERMAKDLKRATRDKEGGEDGKGVENGEGGDNE